MADERRPRLRTRLALLVGSLALTAVLAELFALALLGDAFEYGEVRDDSWAACARYDAELGWANRAGARVHVALGPIDYRVRTNAAGFRDPPRSPAKPPGTRRVIVLGDSLSWGWGVEQGERFSDVLDERLGPEVEVVNLAVPGYGTDQELWLFEAEGLAYEPDVVLLGFVLNDVIDARRKHRYGMQKPRFVRAAGDGGTWSVENRPVPRPFGRFEEWRRELLRSASARSALVSLLRTPARASARGPDGEITLEDRRAALDVKVDDERIQRIVERVDEEGGVTALALGRLATDCAEAGIELLAVALPHNHDQHLYNPEAEAPRREFQASELARRLATLGERLGFETVPVDAALFAEASAGRNLDCGDGHYNARGNRVVAEVLEPVLRGLLSR